VLYVVENRFALAPEVIFLRRGGVFPQPLQPRRKFLAIISSLETLRELFLRMPQWIETFVNPAPEGRPSLAQRFSAG
jgi:hypothetical protein